MPIILHIPDNTPVERLQLNNEQSLQNKLAQWQRLFKQTQSLPHVQSITDVDIEDEIDVYRSGL